MPLTTARGTSATFSPASQTFVPFRAGMTIEQIRLDRKTEAAIERELQIITEAAAHLGE